MFISGLCQDESVARALMQGLEISLEPHSPLYLGFDTCCIGVSDPFKCLPSPCLEHLLHVKYQSPSPPPRRMEVQTKHTSRVPYCDKKLAPHNIAPYTNKFCDKFTTASLSLSTQSIQICAHYKSFLVVLALLPFSH